jgi:hypothetical protein
LYFTEGAFEVGKILSIIVRIFLSMVLSSSYPRIMYIMDMTYSEGLGKIEARKGRTISEIFIPEGRYRVCFLLRWGSWF